MTTPQQPARIQPAGPCLIGPKIKSRWRAEDHWHVIWPNDRGSGYWCYQTQAEAQERVDELHAIWAGGQAVRIYVAGPMTGYPDFNYPAFFAAAARLAELGHDVVNPARAWDGAQPNPTWSDYMRRGVTDVASCDGIALLTGWSLSRGAQLEQHVGLALGLDVRPLAFWLEEQR